MEAERSVALLASLRRLVRGLSALFWGLPVALVVSVQTASARGDWLQPLGFAPVTLAMLLLCYGTHLLGGFQTQERIWMSAVERARLVAIVNAGLSPFLFFWSKIPGNTFFTIVVCVYLVTLLAFLYLLNTVLVRLSAMLPDETLRSETRSFTRVNQSMLIVIAAGLLQLLFIATFVLLPIAMTMALLWKTKEVIMTGVFSNLPGEQPPRGA
jgi:hypothetical protein